MFGNLFFAESIFYPTSIPNCLLWLDAADASTISLSGSAVAQWNDKSPFGNNAVSNSMAQSPSYNSVQFNNLPTLSFTNAALTSMNFSETISIGQCTVFVVGNFSVSGGVGPFLGQYGGSFFGNISGTLQFDAPPVNCTGPSPQDSTPRVYYAVAHPPIQNIYANSTNIGISTASSMLFNPAFVGSNGHASLDGSIAEIIIYFDVLTGGQIVQVYNYLHAKWGIV